MKAPSVVQNVLNRLGKVRTAGSKWNAGCPGHQDRHNSLSVGVGDEGQVLLHCFAGCSAEAIVSAIGLTMADLYPDRGGRGGAYPPKQHCNGATPPGLTLAEYAAAKRLPVEFLESCGLSDMAYLGRPVVRIPYFDNAGGITAVRFRLSLDGKDKFRWRSGDKPSLYGLNLLEDSDHVVLVEGESDAQTLWYHGVPALGLPGAANWRDDRDATACNGVATVYVVHEGDAGGEAIEKWLSASSIRERVKLVSLAPFGVKDPSALHLADPDKFDERWTQALADAVPWTELQAKKDETARSKAWSACSDLAHEPDILGRFVADFGRLAVGEDRNAKLLYLALTSRLLDKPVSVAVKGPSSGGKSFTTESVLRFFPASAYYGLTAMSERALAYSEEPLQHRFLVIYEASGMEGDLQTYLVRSLLSEGCLRYELVEKTKDGLKPRLIEREGPTGLLVTTTAVRLHPENETRLLSIVVKDTPDQTRAILAALADEDVETPDFEPWHTLQGWLASGASKVTIPFAKPLAGLVPPSATRLRRDFGQVLALIRSHALLHQATRTRDDRGRIVATIEDYRAVRDIVADVVAEAVEATVPATVRETVATVQRLLEGGKEQVSQVEIMRETRLDRGTVSRRVAAAKSRGYLKDLEERRGKPSRLVLGEPMPEDQPVLPDPDKVLLRCCAVAGGDKAPPSPPHCCQCGKPITVLDGKPIPVEGDRWLHPSGDCYPDFLGHSQPKAAGAWS